MKYKRLTNQEDNIGKPMAYAHGKDCQVYIYDEKGSDVPLAKYVAKHCANKDMEVTAEDILTGDICMHCDMCTAGILNFVAIQAATLYKRLADLEDKIESGELIELNDGQFICEEQEWRKRSESVKDEVKKQTAKAILQELFDCMEPIADGNGGHGMFVFSENLFSVAKKYGVVLTNEG